MTTDILPGVRDNSNCWDCSRCVPLKGESHCFHVASCFCVAVWLNTAKTFHFRMGEAENLVFHVTYNF